MKPANNALSCERSRPSTIDGVGHSLYSHRTHCQHASPLPATIGAALQGLRRSKPLAWALYLGASACLLGSAAAPRWLIPRAIEMPWTCIKSMVFPRAAQRANIQGTVVLRFQVQSDGSIERITVRQSTQARRNARKEQAANPRSKRSLDMARQFEQAAIDSVASCHFPAMPGFGPATVEVPIEFRFPHNK